MKTISIVLLTFLSFAVWAQSDGENAYKGICIGCHTLDASPGSATGPGVFAVKDHYLKTYPDRADFIQNVKDWVKSPNAADALMPGAIRKFGIMPAFPIPDSTLESIAGYIYDTDFPVPAGYQKHYKAEHGQ